MEKPRPGTVGDLLLQPPPDDTPEEVEPMFVVSTAKPAGGSMRWVGIDQMIADISLAAETVAARTGKRSEEVTLVEAVGEVRRIKGQRTQ